MEINQTPTLNKDQNETGCCPKFDPEGWDGQEFIFKDKPFVKMHTNSFMHIPLNMGGQMKKTWAEIEAAGADSYEFIMLSRDTSPWKGEHYLSVTKPVEGLENTALSGKFMAKVFEGPYKNMRQWIDSMNQYLNRNGQQAEELYFYYTTCPKCAKYYGKNYVVAMAKV